MVSSADKLLFRTSEKIGKAVFPGKPQSRDDTFTDARGT